MRRAAVDRASCRLATARRPAAGRACCGPRARASAWPRRRVPVNRSTSRPATSRSPGPATTPIDQFARNALGRPQHLLGAGLPAVLRRPFTPLAGRLLLGRLRARRPGRLSRPPGSVAPARPPHRTTVVGQRVLRPALRLHRLRPLAAAGARPPTTAASSCRVVMAHEFGARHAGPLRVRRLRAQHPGRDAGRLPRRGVDRAGWTTARPRTSSIRTPELDDVVRGFLRLRDQVGSDPATRQAHGSYFDRVSAFYEGFDKGVASCRDDFGPDRLFTDAAFTSGAGLRQPGQRPLRRTSSPGSARRCRCSGTTVFPHALRQAVHAADDRRPSTAPRPGCRGLGGRNRDLGYCPSDTTVYYDRSRPDRAGLRHDRRLRRRDGRCRCPTRWPPGRRPAGRPTTAAATRSAVCLDRLVRRTSGTAGAFHGTARRDAQPRRRRRGGRVPARPTAATPGVFPNASTTGFELVGAFRTGFLSGGPGLRPRPADGRFRTARP